MRWYFVVAAIWWWLLDIKNEASFKMVAERIGSSTRPVPLIFCTKFSWSPVSKMLRKKLKNYFGVNIKTLYTFSKLSIEFDKNTHEVYSKLITYIET